MKKELKDRWVAALLSGKYQQGKGKLCRINPDEDTAEYCCLGVLAELLVEDGVITKKIKKGTIFTLGLYFGDLQIKGSINLLPFGKTSQIVGLSSKEQYCLTQMNDRENQPFSAIARYIEDNISGE